jgi:gluconolactonase
MMPSFLRPSSRPGVLHTGLARIAFACVFALGLMVSGGSGPVAAQEPPVPADATVDRIVGDLEFSEGPYWRDDGTLVFSDIPANRIYRWTPADSATVFLEPSGRTNGISADSAGRLLLAQHEGRVARLNEDGTIDTLAASYEGKRLNSPNDLDVFADGSIYFTDPPYGVAQSDRELDFSGVYRLHPDGTLELLTRELSRPNGIVFSPDQSRLYVADSEETVVHVYDVGADGSISNRRVFADPTDADAEGTTDGMEVDEAGNLYTTGPGGVWIYAPDGTCLARIDVPGQSTNLAFGGPDRKTLFVTTDSAVYRTTVTTPGLR